MYFQCYIFSVGRRLPTNILITRTSGQLHTSDLLPGFNSSKPEFHNNEPVPFRLTPNLQTFITPIGIEGVLVSALMSIARCLTESEVRSPSQRQRGTVLTLPQLQYDLEHRLSIFIADEMQAWHTSRKMPKPSETQLRDLTLQGVESIVRRAKLLSCKMEREKVGRSRFFFARRSSLTQNCRRLSDRLQSISPCLTSSRTRQTLFVSPPWK